MITVDKNASYPPTIDDLKQDKLLSEKCQYRASKYLNNMIEQDHRFIKRRVKRGLGSPHTKRLGEHYKVTKR